MREECEKERESDGRPLAFECNEKSFRRIYIYQSEYYRSYRMIFEFIRLQKFTILDTKFKGTGGVDRLKSLYDLVARSRVDRAYRNNITHDRLRINQL